MAKMTTAKATATMMNDERYDDTLSEADRNENRYDCYYSFSLVLISKFPTPTPLSCQISGGEVYNVCEIYTHSESINVFDVCCCC